MKNLLLILITILITTSYAQNTNYIGNRQPLTPSPYIQLPLGSIEPEGWFYEQLKLSAEGMTGELDEIWEDVGENNGWLGGTGDSWERGPYWLDGLLPLANILKNQKLIDKANKWIEWTLNSQLPNGFFGPLPDSSKMTDDKNKSINRREEVKKDWWPRMVMLKVLRQYYEATGDERVIDFMTNYFKYQLKQLPVEPLDNWTHWAKARGGENLDVVYWLYNHTGDEFLLDLGKILFDQTYNWTERLSSGEPYNWHGVNTGMGIKQPAVYYQFTKDEKYLDAVKKGIHDLMKYHGQVGGLFSGDELLAGTEPTRGTELCTVVEYMYSLETLIKITGDPFYAEILERVAYNALPAQIEADFTGRQYYQMPNQILCTNDWHNFSVKPGKEIMYGLETGYGCCTANYHQGLPKFAANLWLATDDNGLAAFIYAPSKVTAKVAEGIEVTLREETQYPFKEKIKFIYDTDKEAAFALHLRIPAWCDDAVISVNGKEFSKPAAGTIAKVIRNWKPGDVIELYLPMKIKFNRWHENAASVERGPLVFALGLTEKWESVDGEGRYKTYSVTSDDPWNYVLLKKNLDKPETGFEVIEKNVKGQPFTKDNAPVIIKTKAKRYNDWKQYGGVTGPIPYTSYWPRILDVEEEEIILIPYGCARLRISEFPVMN